MKRTVTKLLTLVLALSMLMTTTPVVNTATAGGGSILTVTPGCGFNMLEWDAIPGAAHYWIYRGPGPSQEYSTPLTDFPISETMFKDTINIKNGQQYCYFVKGVDDDANEFARTTEACGTPRCYEEDECVLVLKYQQDNVMYWVNDEEKGPMETPPVNVNARLFLVARYVTSEIAGTTIDWDGTSRTVIITTRDGIEIRLQIDNKDATVNGQVIQIDPNNPEVTPFISEGRTLVPMRFLAENLGATGPNDIKWFGDTKIVELRFDDPICDECEWIRGEIINTIYHAGATTPVAATSGVPYYEVEFEDCNGNLHMFFSHEDMNDPNGVNPLSEYRGCAELCVYDGIVMKWKSRADLDPCCGGGVEQLCLNMDGEILHTHFDTGTERWEVRFKNCNGVVLILFAETDLWSGNFPISQYMGCATVCITDDIIKAWNAHPEMDDCCGGEEENCFCVEVVRISCTEEFSHVYVKTEGMDALIRVPLDYNTCRRIEEAGGVGTCWKVCGEIVMDDNNQVSVEIDSITQVECPCGGPEKPCICVTITDPAGSRIYSQDANGNTWILTTDQSDIDLSQMDPQECWEVCGDIKPTSVTHSSSSREMNVVSMTQVECPCGDRSKEVCMCFTVERIACNIDPPKVYGKDENGVMWVLYLNSSKECFNMEIGSCWRLCGDMKGENEGNFRVLTNINAEPVTCPCVPDENEICKCVEILRNSCEGDMPVAYAQDVDGNMWVLVLENNNICGMMDIGTCWDICGYPAGFLGNTKALKVTYYQNHDCPCREAEEICFCVEIEDPSCGGNVNEVYAKDEKGNQVVLIFENYDECMEVEPDECWKVCGTWEYAPDGSRYFKVTGKEQVRCPCGGQVTCICVEIEDPACHGDDPMVYARDENGDSILLKFTDHYDCELMQQGDCWEVCGNWLRTADGQKSFLVTSKQKVECPCGEEKIECDEWVKGIVKYLGCREDDKIDLEINGQLVTFMSKHARVCTGFEIGDCVKACVVKVAGAPPIIVKMIKLDPKECEQGDKICFCVEVLKTRCGGDIDKAFVKDTKGNHWVILIDKNHSDMCEKMKAGTCWYVCGYRSPDGEGEYTGFKLEYIEETSCPCGQGDKEICICATILKAYCGYDRPYVLVRGEKGNQWVLYLVENNYDCEKLIPGTCWAVCGMPAEAVNGVRGVKLTYFEQVECPCVSEEVAFCVEVEDPACHGDRAVVYARKPGGDQIVLVFKDPYECETMRQGECWEVHGSWFFDDYFGKVLFRVASMGKVDCPCGGGDKEICICATVIQNRCDWNRPHVIVFDEHGRKWLLYVDDTDVCTIFDEGTCWAVCGYPTDGDGDINGLKVTSYDMVECPCLSEETALCIEVEDPACGGDPPKVYARLPNDKQIVLYFDSEDECMMMQQYECWYVHGSWFFNTDTGEIGFHVASMEKTECPCQQPDSEKYEVFDMIVYDRACDLRIPFYTAVYNGHLYKVYLPNGFDCYKYKVYNCIKVKGTMNGNEIDAVNITDDECDIKGLYGCTVISTHCDEGYIKIKYSPETYKLYYPPYFDCSSINPGDCLTFRGVIYTTGVIEKVSILKVVPCN